MNDIVNFEEYIQTFECNSLQYARGDLLQMARDGKFDIVVQGCNCFKTMKSGIAKQIAKEHPGAVDADNETEFGDYNKLGNYTISNENYQFHIVNAYTQFDVSKGGDVFEYDAFKLILNKLAYKFPLARFGFPLIGMGLARGKPAIIVEMLCEFSTKIEKFGGTVTIVEFN